MVAEALHPSSCSATAINRKLEEEKKHADHSSRTSLTLSGSWNITALTTVSEPAGNGIDVPAFLRPLLGIDFLPYALTAGASVGGPGIPEEAPSEPTNDDGVPRSVEISADEQQSTDDDFPVTPRQEEDDDDDQTSVHSISRVCSPLPKPEETEELQQLLLERKQSARKKKKRGFKAAARAVLHRVSAKKKSSKSNRRHSGSEMSDSLKIDTSLLSPTSVAALPSVVNQQKQDEIECHEISPTATTATEGTLSPLSCINVANDEDLHSLRQQAHTQEKTMKETYCEIQDLQSKLAVSLANYESQLANFQTTQKKLEELAQKASMATGHQKENATTATKTLVATGKPQRMFKRSESGTFIRVHDLELSKSSSSRSSDDDRSLSSLSQSGRADSKQLGMPTPEFLMVDLYLKEIIQQLIYVGFDLATDESDRYTPTRDTARLITQQKSNSTENLSNGWPIHPWSPAMGQEVLVWTGRVSHEGFGHSWPVVKGRAILHVSAKSVLGYMWDSSLVPKYNPMCQGRDDLYILQNDVEMTAQESPYGFAGCAKIVRSLNKHRLLPKGIEMKSLLYARPLEQHKESYIIVSRSVWENDTADNTDKTVIRTEMLMGCTIVRAIDEHSCEMTQLTHVHMPGVPELVARRTAPHQCLSLMKALQSIFK